MKKLYAVGGIWSKPRRTGGIGKPKISSSPVPPMKKLTVAQLIKELAEQKKDQNLAFRLHIQDCDIEAEEIDAIVRRLDAYVASKIDCRQCANCCRELAAALGQDDIIRLARAEGITPEQFERRYLDKSDEPDPRGAVER